MARAQNSGPSHRLWEGPTGSSWQAEAKVGNGLLTIHPLARRFPRGGLWWMLGEVLWTADSVSMDQFHLPTLFSQPMVDRAHWSATRSLLSLSLSSSLHGGASIDGEVVCMDPSG